MNEFCNPSQWNIVSGNWTYDSSECSLTNNDVDTDFSDIIWFGSSDGEIPDNRYCHRHFQLNVTLILHSGINAGLIFRTERADTKDKGLSYYLRLNKQVQATGLFLIDNGVSILNASKTKLSYNKTLNLFVSASENVYNVYLDGRPVFPENPDIVMKQLTNYTHCSIGIRADNHARATFLSLSYTGSNTDTPTVSPTASPTMHPIRYSDFDAAVTAVFNISGWTHSELSHVNNDLESFTSSLTYYVHQGFDHDPGLEFRNIVLNISSINNHTVDDLLSENENASGAIVRESLRSGMIVRYLVECSKLYCAYISQKDSSAGMHRTDFEDFVSAKLNLFFMSTNGTNEGTESSLVFTVESMTMSNDTQEDSSNGSESAITKANILLLCALVIVFVCGISLGVILLHCKRRRGANPSASASPGPGAASPNSQDCSHNDPLLVQDSLSDEEEGREGVVDTAMGSGMECDQDHLMKEKNVEANERQINGNDSP